MDIIEIDDVVPRLYQNQIEAEISSDRMAWFHLRESARRGPQAEQLATTYAGFSATAYHIKDPAATSAPMSALLLPLLLIFCDRAGLPYTSLLRIRLGLFPQTPADVPHHNPHVDFYVPHHTAVYYVNDSDGDTFVFNETFDEVSQEESIRYTKESRFTLARRISPKKGRMIAFDGKHYHASSSPRRSETRLAIAFAFT